MADLEDIYEALALVVDRVGPERTSLVLAKAALSLAHELDDPARAIALIEAASIPDPERE